MRDGILIADPKTLSERNKVARQFVADFKVTLPVLVDTLDDKVNRAYSARPDRLYVIDAEGRVAYTGPPGPSGFNPADIPPVLDRLLGRIQLEIAPPPRIRR